MRHSLHEQARRILTGVAYGDAMGMPTETLTRVQITKKFGRVTGFQASPHGQDVPFDRDFVAGQVTDDTDNTVMLCRVLGQTGQVDAQKFMDALIHWFDEDPTSGYAVGPSTRRAVEEVKCGVPITQTGRLGTTNGAAMKISPIGIIDDWHDLPALVDDVAAVCLPTHNTTVAIQGASIAAACISYGARCKGTTDGVDCADVVDWDEWYELIRRTEKAAEGHGYPYPSADILRRIEYGRRLADETASQEEFENELYGFMGTSPEMAETIPAAVTIAYRFRGSLSESIECCANLGGDTDTIGAICGAMCAGIRFNLEQGVIDRLQTVNRLDFDALASLLVTKA